MMVKGSDAGALSVGVDLLEIDRLRRAVERYGERFLTRIYTPEEIARYGHRLPELAVRLAAKEAVSKALGVGLAHLSSHGIGWQEVEVLSDPQGKPVVRLAGRALALAEEQGLHHWAISLSHERGYALALVVASGYLNKTSPPASPAFAPAAAAGDRGSPPPDGPPAPEAADR